MPGLLKEELRRLDSLDPPLRRRHRRPCRRRSGSGPGGLCPDGDGGARNHPLITVVPGEVTELPEGQVVVASGPLTSDAWQNICCPCWETDSRPP